MSPEFGSTCAIFPIDAETLRYLEFTGRPAWQIELVEAYAKAQGLWHDERSEQPTFSETITLDLAEVVPSIAGPKRPQDRISLSDSQHAYRRALARLRATRMARTGTRLLSRFRSPVQRSQPCGTRRRRAPQVALTLADGTPRR